ncbi:hypothetical protein Ahy_B02g058005 [Arachis hypogaea]|uniref:Uncharacterized protein n=1 Tax=Arachis hypogaea TaxID=3818 RepID=A0A445ADK7_ARAHY|nr:hypothetical protein Ahy_B02g058005 [Arachis hypogaea]
MPILLSLGEQNIDIDSSQPSVHVLGQQSDNHDEPHLTQLNVGSASQLSPQVLSQSSPQLDGANSSDATALDAEDNKLPSVGQSSVHTETRSNRKLVIAVVKGDKPKRFTDHTVTHDITKDLLSRIPSPAIRWQDYCPNMKDELFKGFLKAKLKCRVSFLEVYDDVHKKKSGEYVSEVSKKIIDLYGEAISQKYGEDLIDQLEVDPDVWTEVAETNKKGRVHGLGCNLDIGIYDHRDVPLPEDKGVPTVKLVSQADITEAIKEALPSAINALLPNVVNEAIQSNLLSILSKIPGFFQKKKKDH